MSNVIQMLADAVDRYARYQRIMRTTINAQGLTAGWRRGVGSVQLRILTGTIDLGAGGGMPCRARCRAVS